MHVISFSTNPKTTNDDSYGEFLSETRAQRGRPIPGNSIICTFLHSWILDEREDFNTLQSLNGLEYVG